MGNWASKESLPDCWIFDTGCGHDLTSLRWVVEADKNRMLTSNNPLTLTGAGGNVPASLTLRLQSRAINIGVVEPYVLQHTPCVLSIGRRCVAEGWSFWWPPHSTDPVMIPPNKTIKEGLILEVHGYIPYWREKGQVGSRPVCALPQAKQDGATAAGNKAALPDCPSMPNNTSRRAAVKKGKTSKAGPITSTHRYCPNLDTEDTKVRERKDFGVTHFQTTRSSGPPWLYCVSILLMTLRQRK